MGSNLRNRYGADTKEYRKGVTSGHAASTVAGALLMFDGGGNISAGGSAIAASAVVGSSDAGTVPGSIGALAGAGLIAKGIAETAYGGAIMLRTQQNANADNENSNSGNYSHLKDHKSVGPGKPFTKTQKRNILKENSKRNGGAVRSDQNGEILDMPKQSKKGQKANMNQVEIDHVRAKSKGGSNSYKNSQVLSKKENLKKLDK